MLDRTGRRLVRHRRAVLVTWLLLVVAGFAAGGQVFGRLSTGESGHRLQAQVASQELQDASPTGARVVAVVDGLRPDDTAGRAAVARAADAVRTTPDVASVVDGASIADPRLQSRDGQALLVVVDLAKDLPRARYDAALDAVVADLRRIDVGTVWIGGSPLLNREVNRTVAADLHRAEVVTLPIALVVLVVVFGGLVAAGLPVLAAIATIATALGVLLLFTAVVDLSSDVVSVVTCLGLGLAIDYGLLLVSRFREERHAGRAVEDAVAATVATAGRTVLFSGLTVSVSLAGLFLLPGSQFHSFAAAGVSVVVMAVAAALTLTPALLAVLGRRIRVPDRLPGDDGRFARLARVVQRRPLPVALVVAGVLLAAATPFLGTHYRDGGVELLPRSFETRQVDTLLQTRFAGRDAQSVTVVSHDPALLQRLDVVRQLPGVTSASARAGLAAGTYALDVVADGDSQGPRAKRVVAELRDARLTPDALVTGRAAFVVDFAHEVATHLPAVVLLVAVATFVLLFVMTGSVLVPLKALVVNTLSLGASFGVLTLVFQHGVLAGPLGVDPPGGLEVWVPVLVFVFAFGLSMDYEVFLLSRIQELHRSGHDNDSSVALGLQRSGRIITCAALLLVIVFAGFAAGRMVGIKELGLALAVAVTVDATLVRCLLVPATMTLLGERNWWAPARLRRLHDRIGLREVSSAVLPSEPADGPRDPIASR